MPHWKLEDDVFVCCALPSGAGQYSRIHEGYRISERATNIRPAGRGERLRLRTFLAFLPSAASSFLILGAPAGLRSSFVRPRSRSSRFLFLSLSRRTYSLHPGRCTRGVAYLYGTATVLGAWHDFTIQKNAQQSNSGYHRATFNANIT